MDKTLKIILIVVGSLIVGVVLLGVGTYVWWQKNKDAIAEAAKRADADGVRFAQSGDQNACVEEALRRTDECSSLRCEIEHGIFLHSCLEKAATAASLCEGVPPRGEIFKTAQWSIAECSARGHGDSQPCSRIMQTVQRHCARQ